MGNKYKTAQGKILDIDKIRMVNEKTIAVGNMKVNGGGDKLGRGGEIIQSRNQVMADQYSKIQNSMVPVDEQNVAPDGESFDPPEDVKK